MYIRGTDKLSIEGVESTDEDVETDTLLSYSLRGKRKGSSSLGDVIIKKEEEMHAHINTVNIHTLGATMFT